MLYRAQQSYACKGLVRLQHAQQARRSSPHPAHQQDRDWGAAQRAPAGPVPGADGLPDACK